MIRILITLKDHCRTKVSCNSPVLLTVPAILLRLRTRIMSPIKEAKQSSRIMTPQNKSRK